MKVLVLGSGGREHAMAHALVRSRRRPEVWVAPGNDGMEDVARTVPDAPKDVESLATWAQKESIDLTIAGSEDPLVRGVWDAFDAKSLRLFGPSQAAAALEGSKSFAKEFMGRNGIPTARFEVHDDFEKACRALETRSFPLVVKADGLAAGKGVHIVPNKQEARAALQAMLVDHEYGDAGRKVLLEDMLQGPEISVFAISDGYNYRILGVAQDHKRAHDGDEGPNTGGMGAYSPVPDCDPEWLAEVERKILAPTLAGLVDEGVPYRGFLYLGLMKTDAGPRLLEYNCRLGDPEAQVVLPRLESDFLDLIVAAEAGDVTQVPVELVPGTAVGVVLASAGYPGTPRTGRPVQGIEDVRRTKAHLYWGAVRKSEAGLVTSGGRICNVVGLGPDVAHARQTAYEAIEKLHVEGSYYRRDIAWRALEKNTWPNRASVS